MRWVLVMLLVACGKGEHAHHDEHAPHDEHAHADEHAHEGDEDVVKISAEGARRSGIEIGKVEKRALTGGVAIPAEVQFEPSSVAHVGPLVAGRITKVEAALGDHVKKGQRLGTVISSDASSARARLEQAQARLAAAEAALKRQEQLSTEGIGAQRALIDARSAVDEVRAEVEGQKRQLSVFGSGRAGELTLVAPIEGVVAHVHATLGETATPEEPAFIITDPTKVWVRGSVPELELSRVAIGGSVIVRVHAFPDLAMEGTIAHAAPALDEQTRSLPITVKLAKPDPRLKSGLFGSIELIGGAHDERVLVVPADAVASIEGQSVVFVPGKEPQTYERRAVLIGRRSAGWLEVREGIEEGAAVVVSGSFTLKSALKSGEISDHGHAH